MISLRIQNMKIRFTLFTSLVLSVALLLAGCGGGGGGGGNSVVDWNAAPLHTEFTQTIAYVSQPGVAYPVSVTVSEKRGDPVELNRVSVYRTWADAANSGKKEYYTGTPQMIRGYMFDVPGAASQNAAGAFISDRSSLYDRDYTQLKAYESRTISTEIMVGQPYQSKPSGFTGIFIINSDYKAWVKAGHTGIRYWVTFEGYDYRLGQTYNIYMPLEVRFNYSTSTDPYDTGTPGSSDTGSTDPYDTYDPYDPYNSRAVSGQAIR